MGREPDADLGFSPATPEIVRRPAREAGDPPLPSDASDELVDGFDLRAFLHAEWPPVEDFGVGDETQKSSDAVEDFGVGEEAQKLADALEQLALGGVGGEESAPPLPPQRHADASGNAATPALTASGRKWRKKKSTKGKIRMKIVKDGRQRATPKPTTPKPATPRPVRPKNSRQKRKRKDAAKSASSGEVADGGDCAEGTKPVRRKLEFGDEPPEERRPDPSPKSSECNGCFDRDVLVDNLINLVKNCFPDRNVGRARKRGRKKKLKTSEFSDGVATAVGMDGEASSYSPTSQALAVVPHQSPAEVNDVVPEHAIVPLPNRPKKFRPKIELDAETNRVWGVLMELEASNSNSESFEGADIGSGPDWEAERMSFKHRVDIFISVLNAMIGNRKFSPWKGSVVDSVVGAFLTQNVSDSLSSNAFMSMAAKFPPSKDSKAEKCSEVSSITKEGGEKSCLEENDSTAHSVFSKVGHVGLDGEDSNLDEKLEEDCNLKKDESPDLDKLFHFLKDEKGNPRYNERVMRKFYATTKHGDTSHWDSLRKEAYKNGYKENKSSETSDSVDWERVKDAPAEVIAEAIQARGQHYLLACRIKAFLQRIERDHESINLEWLRYVAPEKAKSFLLSILGLGGKSVDCIRLLSLHHKAFPVDTNVARICTRLGWVQLQPLPFSAEFHLIDEYPVMADIQKYLWPRLCTIEKAILYELHYQMITYGKVICTKRNPNCGACPFRADCKYFNSSFARPTLPSGEHGQQDGPEETSMVSTRDLPSNCTDISCIHQMHRQFEECNCFGRTPVNSNEPIVEMPPSPEYEDEETENVQEDDFYGDIEDMVPQDREYEVVNLCSKQPTLDVGQWRQGDIVPQDQEYEVVNLCSKQPTLEVGQWRQGDGKEMVLISPQAAFVRTPKLKSNSRLRTEYNAYVLPDDHPLLQTFERREFDDQCPYLFIIRTPDKIAGTCTLCDKWSNDCSSEEHTVRGTIMVPCRTANRGSFPLNGTYFQFNEVFADHSSSHAPIIIPREYIWNLKRRIVYFGSSVHSIARDLNAVGIRDCFKEGYICVRGFHQESRLPMPLCPNMHTSEGKQQSGRKRTRSSPKDAQAKTTTSTN